MASILVCDDAADLRMLIRITLEGAGHDVTEADGGVDVLDRLDDPTAHFDAMVLDVQMPVMDGWTVLRRVRAHQRHHALPVLMCTVKFSDGDITEAWTLGCDGYLNKPFDLDALIASIQRILNTDAEVRSRRRALALNVHKSQPATL